MNSKIGIIIRREYMERVTKKSFLVTTILMPVLMIAMMFAPALLMNLNLSEAKRIAVIDSSGVVAGHLDDTDLAKFITADLNVDSISSDRDYDGYLIIGSDIVSNPADASLYTRDAGTMELERSIADNISSIIEEIRLKAYNIENIQQILDEVHADVPLPTYRLGETDGETSASSSEISFVIGLFMSLILYMFLLMYGQMVMTSIIEEKNNRVLELIVTSVKPQQLMMGKIIGTGLVAVTQIVIWALLLTVMSALVLPLILSPELAGEVAAFNAQTLDPSTATANIGMIQAMSLLGDPTYIMTIFLYLLLFLVGGFLLYSSLYAAIGSAVDNVQDGSQLQTFIIVPIILSLIFSTSIANNPNSELATWLSMIPFTSPMVMMTRIPYGIPAWETVTSLVILYASFVLMVWIAAKIYRVGIFMHGKKPSVKDLIRWARYK